MTGIENFRARLKELRTAAGLTQPQLAEKAGLSKGGIADLEQGINQPSWATVVALAAALGVDCRAFLDQPASVSPQPRGRPAKEQPPARKKRGKGKS